MTCTGTDLAGNVGECPITVTLIDNEPPVATCDVSGIPSTIKAGDASFSYVVSSVDDFSGTSSTFNQAGAPGTITFNPTSAQVGTHTIEYIATDAAGNSLVLNPHQAGTSKCIVQFTVQQVYTWFVGPYGSCSATCGQGVKTRVVSCQDSSGANVANSYCPDYDLSTPARDEPATQIACNLGDCAPAPSVDAVLSRVQVTVDDSTGTDVFTLNIEFITGSNQPHSVNAVTGEGSGDNGATGASELSALSSGCGPTFSLTNPELCFQTFRYTQNIDCDLAALSLKFTLETTCLAPSCSLANLFTVTLSLDATNYCEVELTGVELTGTLTALNPGYNMAGWSAARVIDHTHPIPTAPTDFAVQATILGFIQIESSQVIISNLMVKDATREGYATPAMTGTPLNSDAIVTNFVAQSGLSASKFDGDVPANQGPAGGATGPFSARGAAYCAIQWTEPTAAGNAAGQIGALESEYVKITAEIQVDYLLTNNGGARRRVLRVDMEADKMPVLSWLPEASVEKYMNSRRSLLQGGAPTQTATSSTVGNFRKTAGYVAPNTDQPGAGGSDAEAVVPQAVWFALIAMIVLACCVCFCIGVVCCVAFKNKEAKQLGDDNEVTDEPEVNIYLSPMPNNRV